MPYHRRGRVGLRGAEPVDAARGDRDLVALAVEVGAERGGVVAVVLDEENAAHAPFAHGPSAARSSRTARVPPPGASSSQARPWQARAIWRTTARPNPVPVRSEPRSRGNRSYGSKTRARAPAGTPGPPSVPCSRTDAVP